MRRSIRLGLVGALAVAGGLPACTTLLGDFSDGPSGDAGSVDASMDADAEATSCTGAGAPSCGANGSCQVVGGTPSCVCATGYSGPTCSTCSTGYHNPGDAGTGTCAITCASANPTCGAHQACDDSRGPAQCVCVFGYSTPTAVVEDAGAPDGSTDGATDAGEDAGEDGGAEAGIDAGVDASADGGIECVFSAGPLDPRFENTPPGAWQLDGGAALDGSATLPGAIDLGYATLDQAALCTTSGRIQQTFDMPTVSGSEPLALELSTGYTCNSQACYYGYGGGLVALGFGQGYVSAVTTGGGGAQFTTSEICLGERGYGPGVDLSFSAAVGGLSYLCSDPAFAVYIDHASIVPSSTCPAAGTVLNGNFEAAGGWAAEGGGSVKPGIGLSGGPGGDLLITNICEDATLTGTISPPLTSQPQTALQFAYNGTNGQKMSVYMGGLYAAVSQSASLTGGATFQTASLCIPTWMKGLAEPISFYVNTSMTGSCATTFTDEFVIDDLVFATDSRCPVDAAIIDPGIERTDPGNGWATTTYANANASYVSGSQAHSGNGAANLSLYGPCASATFQTTITVPASVGANGPAVTFWYEADAATDGENAYFSSTPGGTLPATATWTQVKSCLDPQHPGAGVDLTFTSYGGDGTCDAYYPTMNAYFDDVAVTTDPSCPAQ
jgi:hypothetical protein